MDGPTGWTVSGLVSLAGYDSSAMGGLELTHILRLVAVLVSLRSQSQLQFALGLLSSGGLHFTEFNLTEGRSSKDSASAAAVAADRPNSD